MSDAAEDAPSPVVEQRRSKRKTAGSGPTPSSSARTLKKARGGGEDSDAQLLRDLRDEIDGLRRKVAFYADVKNLEDRMGELEGKIDYIAHGVHAIQCYLEQMTQTAAAANAYTGGY